MSTTVRPVIAPRRIVVPTASAARAHAARPTRDFGTGYGNSSGYASNKRYVRDWGNARFRFA
jgi:hypothetical protein